MLDRTDIFLFLLFCNACRSDSKSPISPITVAGAVTNLATASICESNDSCFWNPFFFSIAFFQLESGFFVKAGSALSEVSIPFWTAFEQVWQQAASLLASWCNHWNRSYHAVWNDLFVGFLVSKVFEILRLVWTVWYVYKDLFWRAELCLCRFQFASYCWRNSLSKWHQRRVEFSRFYVDIFSTNMVRSSVLR